MRWVSVIAQLADAARHVGAAGVEIAQAECPEPIGAAIVGKNTLDHPFRGAVRIDRRARIALGQRLAVGIAIDRAGGGKYHAIAAGLAHRIEQRQRADDIVQVIFPWIDHGFADQAGRREVHDRDDIVLREGAGERGLVHDIADDERAGDEAAVSGRKIVVDDRMIAGSRQRPAAMRADVTGATGD